MARNTGIVPTENGTVTIATGPLAGQEQGAYQFPTGEVWSTFRTPCPENPLPVLQRVGVAMAATYRVNS